MTIATRSKVKRLGLICLLLFFVLFGSGVTLSSCAESAKTPEYYIKAGFLANFARLVHWPAESMKNSETVNLCVMDPVMFGEALNAIEGKMVRGKKLAISKYDSSANLDRIQILFLNSGDIRLRKNLIDKIKGKPILTVGEFQDFAKNEGMINFFTKNNRVRFEINRTRAEQAGLKISSRLLKFGRLVSGTNENGL